MFVMGNFVGMLANIPGWALQVRQLVLIVNAVLSWFQPRPEHPILVVENISHACAGAADVPDRVRRPTRAADRAAGDPVRGNGFPRADAAQSRTGDEPARRARAARARRNAGGPRLANGVRDAPPEDGARTKPLIELLAELLGVKRRQVVVSGARRRARRRERERPRRRWREQRLARPRDAKGDHGDWYLEHIREAALYVKSRTKLVPEVASSSAPASAISRARCRWTRSCTTPGSPHRRIRPSSHAGDAHVGTIGGQPVAVMKGRVHFYEGYSMRQVAFPVRVLKALGRPLAVTNACGGMNMPPDRGHRDHINLMGDNPLRGVNDDELEVPSRHERAYSRVLIKPEQVARDEEIALQRSIVHRRRGPNTENAGGYRFLRNRCGRHMSPCRESRGRARRTARAGLQRGDGPASRMRCIRATSRPWRWPLAPRRSCSACSPACWRGSTKPVRNVHAGENQPNRSEEDRRQGDQEGALQAKAAVKPEPSANPCQKKPAPKAREGRHSKERRETSENRPAAKPVAKGACAKAAAKPTLKAPAK